MLVPLLTALLMLLNVGFTSFLMFLSKHDLALLIVLMGFSLGMSVFVALALSDSTARSLRAVVRGVREISAGDLAVTWTWQSIRPGSRALPFRS